MLNVERLSYLVCTDESLWRRFCVKWMVLDLNLLRKPMGNSRKTKRSKEKQSQTFNSACLVSADLLGSPPSVFAIDLGPRPFIWCKNTFIGLPLCTLIKTKVEHGHSKSSLLQGPAKRADKDAVNERVLCVDAFWFLSNYRQWQGLWLWSSSPGAAVLGFVCQQELWTSLY